MWKGRKYKILIVEHEELHRIGPLEIAIEAEGAEYEVVTSIEDFEKEIGRSWFDLVIADAKFPEPDKESAASEDGGEYRLNKIIKLARESRLNANLRIVAHTKYSKDLFKRHPDDLEMLDGVWQKFTEANFLSFYIRRLMERRNREVRSGLLIEKISEHIRAKKPAPWGEQMLEMFEGYLGERGERRQVEQVAKKISGICVEYGVSAEVDRLSDFLIKAEPLNLAAKVKAWGHLRHVINVFWLGYFFLNCTNIDRRSVASSVLGNAETDNEARNYELVNLAWLTSALFHDAGLFGERFGRLGRESSALIQGYRIGRLEGDFQKFECISDLKALAGQLNKESLGAESGWFAEVSQKLDHVDHGLLSAALLSSHFGELEPAEVVKSASRSAASHNFWNLSTKLGVSTPTLSSANSPLSCLLVLCDQLEVWDRDTGQESRFSGLQLDAIELAELESRDDGVDVRIAYRPYRHAHTEGSAVGSLEASINEILDQQVWAALKCIDWSEGPFPSIRVETSLGGKILRPWHS